MLILTLPDARRSTFHKVDPLLTFQNGQHPSELGSDPELEKNTSSVESMLLKATCHPRRDRVESTQKLT